MNGIGMLLAYATTGEVVATLDYLVAYNPDGTPRGLVDFYAIESAGGRLRDVWEVSDAAGSAWWPEWLGARAHEFTAVREPDGRIESLVHKSSGHVRSRAAIEAAIAERVAAAQERAVTEGRDPVLEPADLRDLVGGPNAPLRLDERGATAPPVAVPELPVAPARQVP